MIAWLAQLEEHRTRNAGVLSLNLRLGSILVVALLAIVLCLASIRAQNPATRPFELPATQPSAMSGKSVYEAEMREFENVIADYAEISNQYAGIFNELMQSRSVKWDVKKARELVRLRQESDRLWDKLISSPLYRR